MKRTPLPPFRSSFSAFRIGIAMAGAIAAAAVLVPGAYAGPPCTGRAGPDLGPEGGWRFGWQPSWRASALSATDHRWEGTVYPGLWISLDPVTRRPVRPTPSQRASAAPQAPAMDEVLPVERIPGGGELLHLNGRHMVFEVARRGASGRFTTSCASDSAAATRLLSTPVRATARVAE